MNSRWIEDGDVNTYHMYNNGVVNFRLCCTQNNILKEVQAYLGAHLKEHNLPDACTWNIIASRDISDYQRLYEQVKECDGKYIKFEDSGTLTIRDDISQICYLSCIPSKTGIFSFVQDIYCTIRRLSIRSFNCAIVLHASACRLKGKTVLFLGDKGVGKSLVSDSILMRFDSNFIGADQIIIYNHDHDVRCRGNITSYRVWVKDNLLSRKYDEYKNLLKQAPNMVELEQRIISLKINFPPCVVSEILRKNILIESVPDFFFFLGEGNDNCVAEINSSVASRLLVKYILQDGYKDCAPKILKKEETERKQMRLIQEIIAKCRFWKTGKVNVTNIEDRLNAIIATMMGCQNE